MNLRTLSKALRRRLARRFHKGDVAARTDAQIVLAFLLCGKCQQPYFSDSAKVIADAKSADEFVQTVEAKLLEHRETCVGNN